MGPLASMNRISVFLCVVAAGLMPACPAKMGRCLLQVDKKTYLDGPCEIGINDKQGSFTIGVMDTHPSKMPAYINMESDGAHGLWNENARLQSCVNRARILKGHGACWETQRLGCALIGDRRRGSCDALPDLA